MILTLLIIYTFIGQYFNHIFKAFIYFLFITEGTSQMEYVDKDLASKISVPVRHTIPFYWCCEPSLNHYICSHLCVHCFSKEDNNNNSLQVIQNKNWCLNGKCIYNLCCNYCYNPNTTTSTTTTSTTTST